MALYTYLFLDIISDRLYLWLITSFTNNKKIRDGFVNLTQVKGNDVLSLLFLDSCNDGFDDL